MSVAQDLSRDGIGVIKLKPEEDKEIRASIASDQIEPGNVFLPRQARWSPHSLPSARRFRGDGTTIRSTLHVTGDYLESE